MRKNTMKKIILFLAIFIGFWVSNIFANSSSEISWFPIYLHDFSFSNGTYYPINNNTKPAIYIKSYSDFENWLDLSFDSSFYSRWVMLNKWNWWLNPHFEIYITDSWNLKVCGTLNPCQDSTNSNLLSGDEYNVRILIDSLWIHVYIDWVLHVSSPFSSWKTPYDYFQYHSNFRIWASWSRAVWQFNRWYIKNIVLSPLIKKTCENKNVYVYKPIPLSPTSDYLQGTWTTIHSTSEVWLLEYNVEYSPYQNATTSFPYVFAIWNVENLTNFSTWVISDNTQSFTFDSLESPFKKSPEIVLFPNSSYSHNIDWIQVNGTWSKFYIYDRDTWSYLNNGETIDYWEAIYPLPKWIKSIWIQFKKSIFTTNSISSVKVLSSEKIMLVKEVCLSSDWSEVLVDWIPLNIIDENWNIVNNTSSWVLAELDKWSIDDKKLVYEYLWNKYLTWSNDDSWIIEDTDYSWNELLESWVNSVKGTYNPWSHDLSSDDVVYKWTIHCEMFNPDNSFKYKLTHNRMLNVTFLSDWTEKLPKPFHIILRPFTWSIELVVGIISRLFNNILSLAYTWLRGVPDDTFVCFLGTVYKVQYQSFLPNKNDVIYANWLGSYSVNKWERTFIDYFILLIFGSVYTSFIFFILRPKTY